MVIEWTDSGGHAECPHFTKAVIPTLEILLF